MIATSATPESATATSDAAAAMRRAMLLCSQPEGMGNPKRYRRDPSLSTPPRITRQPAPARWCRRRGPGVHQGRFVSSSIDEAGIERNQRAKAKRSTTVSVRDSARAVGRNRGGRCRRRRRLARSGLARAIAARRAHGLLLLAPADAADQLVLLRIGTVPRRDAREHALVEIVQHLRLFLDVDADAHQLALGRVVLSEQIRELLARLRHRIDRDPSLQIELGTDLVHPREPKAGRRDRGLLLRVLLLLPPGPLDLGHRHSPPLDYRLAAHSPRVIPLPARPCSCPCATAARTPTPLKEHH